MVNNGFWLFPIRIPYKRTACGFAKIKGMILKVEKLEQATHVSSVFGCSTHVGFH